MGPRTARWKTEPSTLRAMQLRIGNGYDIHRLVPGRPLILGGQTLEHPAGLGLDGHSDADVLVHAVIDALATYRRATGGDPADLTRLEEGR